MNIEGKVFVILTSPTAKLPTKHYLGEDAGLDLYASESVVIPPRQSAIIDLGIRISLPQGYFATFEGRSSFSFIQDVEIRSAILDCGFTGQLTVKVYSHSDRDIIVEQGDKFVQLIFHKIHEFDVVEVSSFKDIDIGKRGNDKFGSSGRR